MRAEITHSGNFTFESKIRDHAFFMDTQIAAGGDNKGPTPKELMLAGIIGCTGMDIVSLLKKHQMVPTTLKISGDAEPRSAHPRVFTGVSILFEVTGDHVDPARLLEAAELSLTKFCGVSAMVSKVVPIKYDVKLNDKLIGQGVAKFDI
jgi:putative redox protein